jgi:alanyl-tRNA synthetase
VKLEESPFYAEGGGQVADSGEVRWDGGTARVSDVYRVGDDQAVELDIGSDGLEPGARVDAEVDHVARFATMRNHTATHLLHAALRERLGTHVRQAGSAVRPDKLRFDFTHGAPLTREELHDVADRVNEWIKESHPVRALEMSRMEAEKLGAMALFGEKYGDWVRVIEVEGVSRELCGGTHVFNTAAVGIFAIVHEGSSAANVRRIEALTGPAAIDWYRSRSRDLSEVGGILGSEQDPVAAARRLSERATDLEERAARAGSEEISKKAEEIAASGHKIAGITVFVGRGEDADQRSLLDLADRIKSRAGEAAVVLGGADDGKVALVASFSQGVVDRGLSAAEVVREAAQIIGGGGGGRENVAQAGGRDASKLDEALATARQAIESKLGG